MLTAWCITQFDASAFWKKTILQNCATTVVRNAIQWGENFSISPANEKDLHNLFGHCTSVCIHILLCSLRGRFSFNNAHSLFYGLETSSIFHAYATNGRRSDRSRSPLAVRRKQKSKLGRCEYTRIPRVCRWNLISAAFVTKHAAVLFSPLFHSQSRSSSLTHYPFFPLVSQCDRGIGRETRSLLKIYIR